MIEWSWGAFLVYLGALVMVVLGGFIGLIQSHHPAFLAPILIGLFYFYLTWMAVADEAEPAPPPSKQS